MSNIKNYLIRESSLLLIIFLIAVIKGIYFSNYGINIYNYGETLDNAFRILRGEVLYRDIWAIFPPGFGYFPAIILAIFGKSLLIIRYVESIFFAVFVLVSILIARDFLSKPFLSLLSLALIFSDLNTYLFFYYSFFSMALFSVYLYIKSQNRYLIFLSGLFLGIGFLFRHDTTLITFITMVSTLYISFRYKLIKSLVTPYLILLAGLLIITIPSLYFISHIWTLRDFFYMAFVQAPQISTALSSGFGINEFLSGPININKILQSYTLFLYIIFFAVYVSTIIKLFREYQSVQMSSSGIKSFFNKRIVIVSMLMFGLLQIPHAISVIELGHLVKAGFAAIILGLYLVEEGLKASWSHTLKFVLVIPLIFFLAGNLVISVWWVKFNDMKVDLGLGSVYLNSKYVAGSTYASAETIKNAVSFIETYTEESDYIFVAPYQAILYPLSERKNPTRFNNFVGGILSSEYEKEIIASIKQKNVRIIIYDPENAPHKRNFRNYSPLISEYIMSNFDIINKTQEGWLFMRMKEQ